jgi:choline dehydrogenase-like flavoprotein
MRTPEILLASKSAEFPDGLGNAHGVLGHYLHDHPLGKLVIDLNAPISAHPPLYLTRPTLERTPPLYAAACMMWSGTEMLVESARQGRLKPRLPWVGFSVFGTMAPTKDDWITPDGARPESGRLDLCLRHPPAAEVALEQAKDDAMEILTRVGLAPKIRHWHIEPAGESKHYGGSCRMHASPRFGMVDASSRVHGVRNVVVADSSVFTTGPEKNPVLTSMALSARAARKLADDLRAGDL